MRDLHIPYYGVFACLTSDRLPGTYEYKRARIPPLGEYIQLMATDKFLLQQKNHQHVPK